MNKRTEMLKAIKQIVKGKQPSAKIYLYGSRARKSAHQRSDWDVLILLDKEKVTPLMEESITHALYDLEFETGEIISPMVYSEKEWNAKYRVTPFYHSVMREGEQL